MARWQPWRPKKTPRKAPHCALSAASIRTRDRCYRVGWWCTRASRALRDVAGAEHFYAAVIGDGVAHLQVHLLPRYPGTPREYWWDRVDGLAGRPAGPGTGDHRLRARSQCLPAGAGSAADDQAGMT
jgi:diadenosine tetraphosphate (Ap4A) HIT family hydrolase